MHTLRTILVMVLFAAADMAMPVAPTALEAHDEAEESGHHGSRRNGSGRRMIRLPAPQTRDHVHVVRPATTARRVSPARSPAQHPIRKVPPVASDPASALEDQP
jgi:hypothetical protein